MDDTIRSRFEEKTEKGPLVTGLVLALLFHGAILAIRLPKAEAAEVPTMIPTGGKINIRDWVTRKPDRPNPPVQPRTTPTPPKQKPVPLPADPTEPEPRIDDTVDAPGNTTPVDGLTDPGTDAPGNTTLSGDPANIESWPIGQQGEIVDWRIMGIAEPRLVHEVLPKSPNFPYPDGTVIKVTLQIVIGLDGHVESVKVLGKAPAAYQDAARDAIGAWIYEPGRALGQPVKVRHLVVVNFRHGA